MRIILMRHGECKGLSERIINGWLDLPLTAKGKEEPIVSANALKKLIGNIKIDEAYSSYLLRTYDTANIFLREFKFKGRVKQDIRLNERHYGMFQGMKKEDAQTFKEYNSLSDDYRRIDNKLVPENDIRHNALLNEYSMKLKKPVKKIESLIPRSESVIEVENRVNDFLNQQVLIKKNENKTILIVTHANPLKLITKRMTNMTYKKASDLRFSTCALKIFDVRFNKDNVEIINEFNINKEWEK